MNIVSPIRPKQNDIGEQDASTPTSASKYCLPPEIVNEIISRICLHNQPSPKDMNSNLEGGSSGNSQQNASYYGPTRTSFDAAAAYVAHILETSYYTDFLQSNYYAKYQVSVCLYQGCTWGHIYIFYFPPPVQPYNLTN